MKDLVLEINFSQNNKQTVHIGNCEWLHFKSKVFVKDWLKKYKRLINDNVKVLNVTTSNINNLYRTFYFEIDLLTSIKVVENLNEVNKRFDFIFKSFSKGNQNAMVFQNIETIICNLIDVCLFLKDYSNTYKNYSLKNQINAHIKLLSSIESDYHKDKQSLNLNDSYQRRQSLKIVEKKQQVS